MAAIAAVPAVAVPAAEAPAFGRPTNLAVGPIDQQAVPSHPSRLGLESRCLSQSYHHQRSNRHLLGSAASAAAPDGAARRPAAVQPKDHAAEPMGCAGSGEHRTADPSSACCCLAADAEPKGHPAREVGEARMADAHGCRTAPKAWAEERPTAAAVAAVVLFAVTHAAAGGNGHSEAGKEHRSP